MSQRASTLPPSPRGSGGEGGGGGKQASFVKLAFQPGNRAHFGLKNRLIIGQKLTKVVGGLLGTGPLDPTLDLPCPPLRVDLASIQHQFDIDSTSKQGHIRKSMPNQCRIDVTIGAKIITHTTFIVGELILQLHTHQLHSFKCRGVNLCNACVSLVSACLPL